MLPAFALTDYKAQGKTMQRVIVDLESCRGSQSPYVMLSRATSLDGLLILRPFRRSRICCRVSDDLRVENQRLRYLDACTRLWHAPSHVTNSALLDKMEVEDCLMRRDL
ncbi:hypothetical protein BD410DRAFT_727336 [Rickenella mellea]|uniref:Uncharacterized protein n=1 Tax=Rickenella mellea TaxID=50990 RepID=A0A4Y7PVC0_9AGAM|nr:hypothetical protein BD410DRAFT_727336 [Rickenella mellea]